MKTRGQTALEYLVTYGWAILAIVIIAGVLWYFGVFTPGRFAAGEQTYGFSTVEVLGHSVASGASPTLTLVLTNRAGESVTIQSVYAGLSGTNVTSINIPSGGQAQVTGISTALPAGSKGDSYTLNVTITYALSRTGLTGKVSSGTVASRMG